MIERELLLRVYRSRVEECVAEIVAIDNGAQQHASVSFVKEAVAHADEIRRLQSIIAELEGERIGDVETLERLMTNDGPEYGADPDDRSDDYPAPNAKLRAFYAKGRATTASGMDEMLRRASERVGAMSLVEREAMLQAQRASWARGMAPCEHGMVDFEQCPDCRGAVRATPPEPRTAEPESAEPVAWLVNFDGVPVFYRYPLSAKEDAELFNGTVVPLFAHPRALGDSEPTPEQVDAYLRNRLGHDGPFSAGDRRQAKEDLAAWRRVLGGGA